MRGRTRFRSPKLSQRTSNQWREASQPAPGQEQCVGDPATHIDVRRAGDEAARSIWRPGALATVVAALVGLLASPPAIAAQPSAVTLSNPEATLRWEGHRLDSGERDEFLIHVSLPPGVWARPGALQIGIRWPYGDLDDGLWDLDLTVFGPDGRQAGSSAGGDEDAESVNIDAAQNGTYRVVVDAIDADPNEFAYEGMAQVERSPGASPLRDLLPDLAVRPHRRVTFSPTRVGVGQIPIPNFVNGCMADEIIEAAARPLPALRPEHRERGRRGDGAALQPGRPRSRPEDLPVDPPLRRVGLGAPGGSLRAPPDTPPLALRQLRAVEALAGGW